MKTDFERAFIRAGRRGQRLLQDDLIALVPREYAGHVAQLGGAKSLVFDIVMPGLSPGPAGEIALRVGEDASLFYLGHIGYHAALSGAWRRAARLSAMRVRPCRTWDEDLRDHHR